jgi:hypothetical protein
MTKELEALKARNAELEERIEKLENQLNPKPLPASNRGPRDYTEGFSMPPSAMRAMVEALPGAVVRELAVDARKPNPVTGGPNPPPTKQRATPNWVDERPLESPTRAKAHRRTCLAPRSHRQSGACLCASKSNSTRTKGK